MSADDRTRLERGATSDVDVLSAPHGAFRERSEDHMTQRAQDPIRSAGIPGPFSSRRKSLGDRLGDLISDWLPRPRPARAPIPVAATSRPGPGGRRRA